MHKVEWKMAQCHVRIAHAQVEVVHVLVSLWCFGDTVAL